MNRSPVLVAVLALSLFAPVRAQLTSEDAERARQTWEEMLLAKGGRPVLHQVESLLCMKGSRGRTGLFSHKTYREEYLLAFPIGMWNWVDGYLTLTYINVTNFETGRGYLASSASRARRCDEVSPGEREEFRRIQAVYLLETRWLQPRPLRLEHRRDGLRRVDVVSMAVDPFVDEYYLDPRTRLPSRVREYWHGRLWCEYRFSDYREVAGIMLPHREDYTWGGSETSVLSWEVNPAYDAGAFSRQPVLRDGARAWKRPPR